MNTILGWLSFDQNISDPNIIASAMAEGCVFGHQVNTSVNDEMCFSISAENKHHIDSYYDKDFVVGIIRNGVNKHAVTSALDFASQYKTQGIVALSNIDKPFACFLYDRKEKKLILGIDKLGVCNLAYTVTSNYIVFASTIDMLLAHPEVNTKVSNQAIYNYLHFHIIPAPQTIYENIYKLRPASFLSINNNKAIEQKYYWQPDFHNKFDNPNGELSNNLREILYSSVKACSNDADEGSFLSGGLDSSTISGLLHSVNPDSQAFTIGFGEEGYDEVEYARIVAQHFGIGLNEYYVTKQDVLNAISIVAKNFDEPFGNSSAIPVYYCAKLAKENNVQNLLAGDGGDELFAGNERYRTQLIYELYKKFPKLVKKLMLEPLFNSPLLSKRISLFRKGKSYISEAAKDIPERIDRYSIYNLFPDGEIYTDEFLSQIDKSEPLNLRQELYASPQNADVVDRMLYVDWQHTLADNDLRKVNFMCSTAGINVSYPMLSDEMLEFSTKIHNKEKIRLNKLRFFYKKTFSGYLPKEVINKSKHGFGLPFGIWMRTSKDLKQLANESLLSLEKRDIFRSSFLREIQEKHAHDHASFYGELIWVLMLLEQWMQKRYL